MLKAEGEVLRQDLVAIEKALWATGIEALRKGLLDLGHCSYKSRSASSTSSAEKAAASKPFPKASTASA